MKVSLSRAELARLITLTNTLADRRLHWRLRAALRQDEGLERARAAQHATTTRVFARANRKGV